MKKHYFSLIVFAGLIIPTVITAFYSAKSEVSETVFAQVGVIGCWQRVTQYPTQCGCEGTESTGYVDNADNGEGGYGTRGFRISGATCETSIGINCK